MQIAIYPWADPKRQSKYWWKLKPWFLKSPSDWGSLYLKYCWDTCSPDHFWTQQDWPYPKVLVSGFSLIVLQSVEYRRQDPYNLSPAMWKIKCFKTSSAQYIECHHLEIYIPAYSRKNPGQAWKAKLWEDIKVFVYIFTWGARCFSTQQQANRASHSYWR